jgi:ribosome-associated toxin RatA of RatAB toxin-antitoxin module
MADESTQATTVVAAPSRVMAVIADFASYPEWADGIRECEVVDSHPDGRAKQVRFVVDAGVIKDEYVLEYDWAESGLRVDWQLVKGQLQRSQHGSYELRPAADGSGHESTEVVYRLAVDLAVPMLGVLKRRAEKMIMDTALRKLKARVERADAG